MEDLKVPLISDLEQHDPKRAITHKRKHLVDVDNTDTDTGEQFSNTKFSKNY